MYHNHMYWPICTPRYTENLKALVLRVPVEMTTSQVMSVDGKKQRHESHCLLRLKEVKVHFKDYIADTLESCVTYKQVLIEYISKYQIVLNFCA